ncbi:hypothetical protein Bbelb_229260 [Branchiostoma belcheri]|nr:hypothetical protein Bbelb_229260 [Branchiostoma belcheri]
MLAVWLRAAGLLCTGGGDVGESPLEFDGMAARTYVHVRSTPVVCSAASSMLRDETMKDKGHLHPRKLRVLDRRRRTKPHDDGAASLVSLRVLQSSLMPQGLAVGKPHKTYIHTARRTPSLRSTPVHMAKLQGECIISPGWNS